MKRHVLPTIAAMLMACSNNDDDIAAKQKECDAIAADIRDKAVNQYKVPAQGACNNPSVQVPFAQACASLARCNQELSDLKSN